MIFRNVKLIVVFILFVLTISGCNRDSTDFTELLKSHQWNIAYYIIQNEKKIYYATEYKYRIQFREGNKIAIFKQSGDVEYGNWIVEDNKIVDIKMDKDEVMYGKWELIKYYVWGYDQDRIQLKNNNKEMGLY